MIRLNLFLTLILIIQISISAQAQNALANAQKDAVVKKHAEHLSKGLKAKGLSLGNQVFFRIIKEAEGYDSGCLEVWVQENNKPNFKLFKTYAICTFSGGLGTKTKQGDGKTPEGFYYVTPNRINQYSSYHRAFNIGYPNKYERLKSYTGNYIMVHGACCSIGCIAMSDKNIEEIWTLGIKALAHNSFFRIHIFPFYMTEENIKNHPDYKDSDFLQELKSGYDYFETHNRPPDVNAAKINGKVKYTFK